MFFNPYGEKKIVNNARHKGEKKHLGYISVLATITQHTVKLLPLLFIYVKIILLENIDIMVQYL